MRFLLALALCCFTPLSCWCAVLTAEQRSAVSATLVPAMRYREDNTSQAVITAGRCTACAWNAKRVSSPVVSGSGLQWLRHLWFEKGFNTRETLITSVVDALQYEALPDQPSRAPLRCISPRRPPVADITGRAYMGNWSILPLNFEPVACRHGHPTTLIPFIGGSQAHNALSHLPNTIARLHRRFAEPLVRFHPLSAHDFHQLTPSQPPFRGAPTAPLDALLAGATESIDGAQLYPLLWSTRSILETPDGVAWNTTHTVAGGAQLTGTWLEVEQNPFIAGLSLWCAPHLTCDVGVRETGVCVGLGGQRRRLRCVHGVRTATGQCHCHRGFAGAACEAGVPPDFFPHNASACPSFDLCSGRGVCVTVRELLGLSYDAGVTCRCKRGFFGGTLEDITSEHGFTHAQMVSAYASSFFCRAGSSGWSDESGWSDSYPYLHQCALYRGELQPEGFTLDPALPTVPVSPWNCTDTRNGSTGFLYGGLACSKCPNCEALGVRTVSCDTVPAWDATGVPRCLCADNYAGARCELEVCPVDRSGSGGGVCGRNLGRGHCVHKDASGQPFSPWNSSYTGRCQCAHGWGAGPDGACTEALCGADWLTGQICGAGSAGCNTSACAITALVELSAHEACLDRCITEGDVPGAKRECVEIHGGLANCCKYNGTCPVPLLSQTHTDQCLAASGVCQCREGYVVGTGGLCELQGCPPGAAGDNSSHCPCDIPFLLDTDSLSPTFAQCVDACGAHGTADVQNHVCVCAPAYRGDLCDRTICPAGVSAPSRDGTSCVCARPQFTGRWCNESACVGGSSVGNDRDGCVCLANYGGLLCDELLCSEHGTAQGEACVCDAGWYGQFCELSLCWTQDFTLPALPCGSVPGECVNETLGYHCRCGDAAFFDHAGAGGCVLLPGAEALTPLRGRVVLGSNLTLGVVCALGLNGTFCQDDVCGNNGTGPSFRQYVEFVDTPAVLLEDPLRTEVLQHRAIEECRCISPFYDLSSGCARINCSLLLYHPALLSTSHRPLVQLSEFQCGCESPLDRVEHYDEDLHALGLDDSYQSDWDQAHPVGLPDAPHDMRLLCVRNCHRAFTKGRDRAGGCLCWNGYGGELCDRLVATAVYPELFQGPSQPVAASGGSDDGVTIAWTAFGITMGCVTAAVVALYRPELARALSGARHSYQSVNTRDKS